MEVLTIAVMPPISLRIKERVLIYEKGRAHKREAEQNGKNNGKNIRDGLKRLYKTNKKWSWHIWNVHAKNS